MARKQVTIQNILIHGIADRGKGVGRTAEGMAVFVEGAVPGDVVDVLVQKKKGGFAEGKVEAIITPSPDRVEAFCAHFSICGGCKWQNLDYQAQLHHKQQVVDDALRRIGKIEIDEFLPILGAPETVFYRNKLEFGFSNKRWLLEGEYGGKEAMADLGAEVGEILKNRGTEFVIMGIGSFHIDQTLGHGAEIGE